MKIDFKGLLEGIKNTYFPTKELKEQILSTSLQRLEVCKSCPFYSLNSPDKVIGLRLDVHCTNCGCNLEFKSKCLSCSCPQGKWDAHLTEAQEKELLSKLNESQESNT